MANSWSSGFGYSRTFTPPTGGGSSEYLLFLWFGMPLGCFLLDLLMFLEPFGLLPITPMPENLRQFIPSYKATRLIAEVLVEALPQ